MGIYVFIYIVIYAITGQQNEFYVLCTPNMYI